jgi:hypothetical protein
MGRNHSIDPTACPIYYGWIIPTCIRYKNKLSSEIFDYTLYDMTPESRNN